jgi:gluconokinase
MNCFGYGASNCTPWLCLEEIALGLAFSPSTFASWHGACYSFFHMNDAKCPTMVIFMGVAGTGKSTVGALFAKKTGAVFYEGDDFHSPGNVAKMRAGIPLTDADRAPWLSTLRKVIIRALATEIFSVLTCSALKASYRDTLAAGDLRVGFVHLTGPPALIAERLKNRPAHFLSPTLLENQLTILEPPANALVFSCEQTPEAIVGQLLQHWGLANPD